MKNNAKPFVVIVFPTERANTSTRYGGFAARLKKAGGFKGYDIITVALENLAYVTYETKEAHVIDPVSGKDLGNANFVYLKSWEAMPEEAAALATYLFYKGVQFIDTLPLGMGVSKLATMYRLWSQAIAMPHSVYVRRSDRLAAFLESEHAAYLGDRFILKDIVGMKGKHNYLTTRREAIEIIKKHPDIQFVCQRFIPNDGDYRVGIYIDEPGFVIKRVGNGNSHLNNTSTGGTAEYIPVHKASKKLLAIAQQASSAANLQVAGVDIIRDVVTKKWYVLEVNQGSQIVTGAYVKKNVEAFNTSFDQALRGRYKRPRQHPTRMIGRRATAGLFELGIKKVTAKIDTGAYSSTLHAENIHVSTDENGLSVLTFDIHPSDLLETVNNDTRMIRTHDFFMQRVRSSNGQVQERYSIKTPITIEKRRFMAVITLSDRSAMGYPLLIGRKMLRSRFIVNVELDENNHSDWKY